MWAICPRFRIVRIRVSSSSISGKAVADDCIAQTLYLVVDRLVVQASLSGTSDYADWGILPVPCLWRRMGDGSFIPIE